MGNKGNWQNMKERLGKGGGLETSKRGGGTRETDGGLGEAGKWSAQNF
jgi:hypothetical protein